MDQCRAPWPAVLMAPCMEGFRSVNSEAILDRCGDWPRYVHSSGQPTVQRRVTCEVGRDFWGLGWAGSRKATA
jgi:hypothetical protein